MLGLKADSVSRNRCSWLVTQKTHREINREIRLDVGQCMVQGCWLSLKLLVGIQKHYDIIECEVANQQTPVLPCKPNEIVLLS